MTSDSDRVPPRLMRRFGAGDPEAVQQMYELFGGPVFAVAYRALGDRGLAEEAVQQTFLQAWRSADKFESGRAPAPWLYAIARRVAVDLYRRERRHVSSDGVEPEIAVLPASFERMWEAWEVRSALLRLPDDEREILEATHFRELSHSEAAELLGIPVGTVKSRSHRAYRRLAAELAHMKEAYA